MAEMMEADVFQSEIVAQGDEPGGDGARTEW